MGVVPVSLYTASWTGWFLGDKNAYHHDDYVRPGQNTLQHAIAVLHGWWKYHQEAFTFHRTLYTFHPYASRPVSWLFQGRPVAYYYTSPTKGQNGCTANTCAREVLGVGTTAIWLPAIAALVICVWWSIARRDWRASGIVVAFAASWVTWLPFAAYFPGTGSRPRTSFMFYALPCVPFMILAIVLVLGFVLGPPDASPTRRTLGRLSRRRLRPAGCGRLLVPLPDPRRRLDLREQLAAPDPLAQLDLTGPTGPRRRPVRGRCRSPRTAPAQR